MAERRYNPPKFRPEEAYASNPRFRKFIKGVGKGLEDLRRSQGWSQADLSRILGHTGNRNLGKLERAEAPGVHLSTIFQIADALGYDVEIRYVRRKERHGVDGGRESAAEDRGADGTGGESDRNVVQLRPIQPYPSWYQRHR